MSILSHLLIFISYALAAVAVGAALPGTVLGLDGPAAYAIGGIVFVAGALLHEVFSRRLDTDALAAEIHDLRLSRGALEREVEALRRELEHREREAGGGVSDEIVAEMRMLKALLARLDGRAGAPPRPAAPPASAAPPSSLVGLARDPEEETDGGDVLRLTQEALEENRIELYLQPVVSLPQRKTQYYEAFSRIRGEHGGIIGPDRYLPVAERSGLVATIDNILLFRCVQLVRRLRRYKRDAGFICNISPHTLEDEDFFAQFTDFMGSNADLAHSLVFELSQSELEGCGPATHGQLERLAKLGFEFSMDQVSDLDLDLGDLRRRHFRFVKVEAERLLGGVDRNQAQIDPQDLAEAMRREGIELVAEKVESERIVPELLDCNVGFAQGYLFGEPRLARLDAA